MFDPSPGFMDIHAHSELTLLVDGRGAANWPAVTFVRDGEPTAARPGRVLRG